MLPKDKIQYSSRLCATYYLLLLLSKIDLYEKIVLVYFNENKTNEYEIDNRTQGRPLAGASGARAPSRALLDLSLGSSLSGFF